MAKRFGPLRTASRASSWMLHIKSHCCLPSLIGPEQSAASEAKGGPGIEDNSVLTGTLGWTLTQPVGHKDKRSQLTACTARQPGCSQASSGLPYGLRKDLFKTAPGGSPDSLVLRTGWQRWPKIMQTHGWRQLAASSE